MKKIRWSDFSLVSKIMIEVGVLAVLLFSINMLFYVRINNSMQDHHTKSLDPRAYVYFA